MLDRDYVPEDLLNLSDFVPATKSAIYFNSQAVSDYVAMINEMDEYGLRDLYAVSGYRTYYQQDSLYKERVGSMSSYMEAERAKIEAGRIIAPPGASEHQTGLALDVSSRSVGFALNNNFVKTPEYAWLLDNCHRYGFIIRYPADKTDVTDIIFEPWHLRYVGAEHAAVIYESGMCLEDYIETMSIKGESQ